MILRDMDNMLATYGTVDLSVKGCGGVACGAYPPYKLSYNQEISCTRCGYRSSVGVTTLAHAVCPVGDAFFVCIDS